MSEYIVFTRETTLDPAELAIYWEQIGPTFDGHEVEFHASYGRHEVLKGAPSEGVIIAKFQSLEAAKAWYDSPEYRAVREQKPNSAGSG
jgi:uncharacterized protein (DUF1330 family)